MANCSFYLDYALAGAFSWKNERTSKISMLLVNMDHINFLENM